MLTIHHNSEAGEELLADIVNLEGQLGVHGHNYPKVYNSAELDHRVEIPFMSMAQVIDILQEAKNKHYDNSWSKRGLFSCYFNCERKWERLSSQVFNTKELVNTISESFLDTCIDLAAYAVKLCAWICARRPEAYLKLLKTVQQEGVDAGTILKP